MSGLTNLIDSLFDTWVSQLYDASYRGVPFHVNRPQTRGGRRVVNHQYPRRNRPYAEDLGRRQHCYDLDGYVIGINAFAKRNALIAALDADGPGTLVHPTFGVLRVQVEDWGESEDLVRERRICRFRMSFVEAGDPGAITVTADTSALAAAAATAASAINLAGFIASFTP